MAFRLLRGAKVSPPCEPKRDVGKAGLEKLALPASRNLESKLS